MSLQQAEQTPLVYPVSETIPPSHRQSDGSFGAVFIVLAVIVVISVIACFLGRLCNKRHSKLKPSKHSRPAKEKDMKPSRNAFQTKDGDIEFGFDKRFSSAKVAANSEPNMGHPHSNHEPNMGPNMGRPNSFRDPNMGPGLNMGPGPNMVRPNSFKEPSMGRPNSFRKGEFRDDHVRFGGNQDHEMNFKSGTGPQHY